MGRQEVPKSRPGPWHWSEALPELCGASSPMLRAGGVVGPGWPRQTWVGLKLQAGEMSDGPLIRPNLPNCLL